MSKEPKSAGDDWEVVEVEATKPVGVVLSARIPRDTAEKFATIARSKGLAVSALLRQLVEDTVSGRGSGGDVSFGSPDADTKVMVTISGSMPMNRTMGVVAEGAAVVAGVPPHWRSQ
jgi:hypothetical protein